MQRFFRVLSWTLLALIVLITGTLIVAWFVDFRQTDGELTDEFREQRVRPSIHRYQIADPTGQSEPRIIRFMETKSSGDSAQPVEIVSRVEPWLSPTEAH